MESKDRRNYNVFFNTHTVSGIVISLGLFVCFFAGAFALFMDNINHWEANTKKADSFHVVDYEKVLQTAEEEGYHMDRRDFFIGLREGKEPYVQISSQAIHSKYDSLALDSLYATGTVDSAALASIFLKLDPNTYEVKARKFERSAQQLGTFLYRLHYFQPIPMIGLYLSGLVALFFLFAILTGIIIHWKKIVSNFFTFRLKGSIKNLWTDAHTALGVIGLPFQFMYAVTGAIYGLLIVIFLPTMMVLFDGDQDEMISYVAPTVKSAEATGVRLQERANVNTLFQDALSRYEGMDVKSAFLNLKNYNDSLATMSINLEIDNDQSFYSNAMMAYQLSDGKLIKEQKLGENEYTNSVILTVHKLHFAQYGGYFVKGIYFILALLTCFVILSGVLIWLEARNKRAYISKMKFNRNVGAIYIGATMGMFPAIALMFCLTKVLPLEMDSRFSVIAWSFLFFWVAYTVYSYIIKDIHRINKYALGLGGALGVLIPILNGIQSDLWIWKSLALGYTDTFFIDTAWLCMGAIALVTTTKVKPFTRKKPFMEDYKTDKKYLQQKELEKNLVQTKKPKKPTMTNQLKVVLLWLTISFSLVIHSVLETSETLYFKPLPDNSTEGSIPTEMHVIFIVAMIFPLIMSVVSMFFSSKAFKISSMVYAGLLILLNSFHVIEEGSLSNPSQLILLSFVAAASVLLMVTLNRWRKEGTLQKETTTDGATIAESKILESSQVKVDIPG